MNFFDGEKKVANMKYKIVRMPKQITQHEIDFRPQADFFSELHYKTYKTYKTYKNR